MITYVIISIIVFGLLSFAFGRRLSKKREKGTTKKMSQRNKPIASPPLQIEKVSNGLSIITWIKNGKAFKKQTVGYNKPRPMTTTERLFYSMKPNLQYWYDNGTLSNGKAKE